MGNIDSDHRFGQGQSTKFFGCRRRKLATAEGFRSAGNEQELAEDASDGDAEAEGELAIQQAWTELADIEREQERWSELRTHIEQKLEMCRQRGVTLEDVRCNAKSFQGLMLVFTETTITTVLG